MLKFIGRWLNVYQDEIGLFLWSALVLFLIQSSNMLFNNFGETAFLKRFGVEYLPVINVANSISTFFIMGFLAGLLGRIPGSRLLTYMLLVCGASVAGLRFIIPLGFELLYPILYILKTQYEVLLGLLFWNLANDLFNTRQSKRLFPLIIAGGVIGGIIGSFGTPFLVKAISLDNLMWVYLGTTWAGALVVRTMGARYPSALLSEKEDKKQRTRTSILGEFKNVLPFVRESKLAKILIMLTLVPNAVIPIINYQFSFAVDQTYATEGGMITFFGYFRGAMNVATLLVIPFVGRLFGRFGLAVALMFHPFNYVLAFLAFLLRFDIFSAIYARLSTTVLRTAINNPARAVLFGLFPSSYRATIRPFLRGTVVRVGILSGSGIILLSQAVMHPRYLSLICILFVLVWIITTFYLKRVYSGILLDLISKNMVDLKSMKATQVSQIFKDKKLRAQLVNSLLTSRGENCLWYADLLDSLGHEDLDQTILAALKAQDDRTRIALLAMLSPQVGKEALPVFMSLADPSKQDLMVALAKAASRLPAEISAEFYREVLERAGSSEAKAYGVSGVYRQAPQQYKSLIDSWLGSEDLSEKKAGVIAAGNSGDPAYIGRLRDMLGRERKQTLVPPLLEALDHLEAPDLNAIVLPYLSHPTEGVRLAALEAFDINGEDESREVIGLLGDPSDRVHELAKQKLEAAPYQNPQLLIESLTIPRRRIREGVFSLLELMKIKDVDVFRFARSQLEKAFGNLAEAEAVRQLPESRLKDLLAEHLHQRIRLHLENILRSLAVQDRTGQMRTIWRGVLSADSRQRSNSLEALEGSLDRALSRIMVPLLENLSPSQCLSLGKKHFNLPSFDSNVPKIYAHLLSEKDWVTVVLALALVGKQGFDGMDKNMIQSLAHSEDRRIRSMALRVIAGRGGSGMVKEDELKSEISIPDKILHLKGIQIFEGLSVSELAAIASVTEQVVFPTGEIVIREGEPGETMYLVVSGEVSVIKTGDGEKGSHEIELDRIRAGDYFGEMALFEDIPRTATIRTAEESLLLVLHKQEFAEIVREYPQIALHICRELSGRIRRLHEKVKNYEKNSCPIDA